MASVFTFDPDPPRISSPWSIPPVSTPRSTAADDSVAHHQPCELGGLPAPTPSLLADHGIVTLQAEPQDGPVEYKLHLLLKPRRSFLMTRASGDRVFRSYQSRSVAPGSNSGWVTKPESRPPPPMPSFQARQKRLEGLTTQLLWRLQQSSPYHSSSTAKLILPTLPETSPKISTPTKTEKLLSGLEESRGALYEIGVSDDGTFVGLTKDEMDESLVNLRAMAASLGCKVEILRTVIVNECKSTETALLANQSKAVTCTEDLWVAEALILPETHEAMQGLIPGSPLTNRQTTTTVAGTGIQAEDSQTQQLRVSLTGQTTSGKSSLIGTLATSVLDSGRGKTRLNLLKHRHEIESGITSSVAPELIGYRSQDGENGDSMSVVNYGFGNISSWNDIQDAAQGGRLIFLVDSAGHPKYIRTAIRGLVSWAPHWTICCVPADSCEDTMGVLGATVGAEEILGPAATSVDLSKAYLDLCLKLELPLIVVVTKMDLASKGGLRASLANVLSILKAAGRTPVLLRPDGGHIPDGSLKRLSFTDEDEVRAIFNHTTKESISLVPVVLTSAVNGNGVSKLHALLRYLPIPSPEDSRGARKANPTEDNPESLFHIDEIYAKSDTSSEHSPAVTHSSVLILSGYLRRGSVCVGDEVLVGPFPIEALDDPQPTETLHRAHSVPARLSGGTPPSPDPVSALSHHNDLARSSPSQSSASATCDSRCGSYWPGRWARWGSNSTRAAVVVMVASRRRDCSGKAWS